MRQITAAFFAASLFVASVAMLGTQSLAQQPNFGQTVGPGTSMGLSVFAVLYPTPSGIVPQAIASLPVCTAALSGGHAFLTNGAVSTPGATVSATGAVFGVEVVCAQVTAGPTYGWVYD